MRNLYLDIVERRNFVRQGAPNKQGDGVVTYVEPKRVEEQRSIMEYTSTSSRGEIDAVRGVREQTR